MSVKQDKVQVSVIVDGKQGISELGKLEMEANDLRHTMQGLKRDSAEYAASAEQYKEVKAKMAEMREEIGLTGLTMKQLRAYARELQAELDTGTTRGTQRYDELKNKLQEVNGAIAKQRAEVAGTTSFWSKISTEVKQFGMLAVGALGFQFLADQVQNLIAKGAKLSDELADIAKTTGMTSAEVRELNSALSQIDTRTSTSELRKIAAGAGQLGIAKKDVLAFTEATDKLVVSLGDEFQGGAEEVTRQMGALRNIFADVKSDNVSEDMLRIGNSLNTLGASGAATGPVVADFANRIGGVGITMGLTSGQVLGLSATLQELNVSTERGGTATVKILQAMAGEPAKFAKVAGLSVKEFTNLVNTDLYGALVKVSEGVAKNGGSATALAKILQTLGVDGAGASEVMAKLGANTTLLDDKVKLASTSLGSTNSIMSEFATKNDDLAGKIEKLTKKLSGLFTNSAFNEGLEAAVDGLSKLFGVTDEMKELTAAFAEQQAEASHLNTEVGPLLERYKELKEKASLNKDEQKEMDAALQQLAKTIPEAVEGWNSLGQAIGFNTVAGDKWLQQQKDILSVKNAPLIEETTEAIAKQEDLIKRLTFAMNRIPVIKMADGSRSYFDGQGKDVLEFQRQIEEATKRLNGYRGLLAQMKGEKTPEQLAAEQATKAKKGLQQTATETLGLLEQIDANIKDLRQRQYDVTAEQGQAAAANEIQRIGREIKAQEELKKKLLGEADDKEAERRRKALEKQAKQEHDAALKNLRDLQAIAMQEEAKLRDVDAEADQQELNRLDAHYEELISKALAYSKNTKLTEKERREAIALIDLLADEKEEAHNNLKQKQEEKRAADALKLENQLALDRANLRILLAKRNEKTDPEEYKNALIAKVELERDIQLQNTKLTETQKQQIIADSEDKINAIRQSSSDKQKEKLLKTLNQFEQSVSRMLTVFSNFMKGQSDAALKRADKEKDSRLSILEKEKTAGTITTEQYEAQKAQVQQEYDRKAAIIKHEAAEQEKATAAFKIGIDTSVAIIKTYAELGAPAAIPMAALIGAMGVIELASVLATPVPEFKAGGFTANGLTGLEHQNLSQHPGGMLPGRAFMATVNEVGPEYFVPHHLLQQPQVAGAVGLIEAIRTGSPAPAFPAQGPAFAGGGYSAGEGGALGSGQAGQLPDLGQLDRATALRLAVAAEQLSQALRNPTPVRSYIVYRDLAEAEDQLNQLKADNSF